MKPKLSEADYARAAGQCCPNCGRTDNVTTTETMQVDGGAAWQRCRCGGCCSTWVDTYVLTGYEELQIDDV